MSALFFLALQYQLGGGGGDGAGRSAGYLLVCPQSVVLCLTTLTLDAGGGLRYSLGICRLFSFSSINTKVSGENVLIFLFGKILTFFLAFSYGVIPHS